MKKITLIIFAVLFAFNANAQFSYTTIKTDGFETTDGLPATFTRTGQAAWSTATSPYTGGFWDLIYASATPKDYVVTADQTEFKSGAQCIKVVTGTSTVALRLRSVTNSPFSPSIAEWTKYKVTIWAKGTAGSQIFDKITTLATGGWDKYEFTSNYSTGLSETRLMLDLKATAGVNTTIYFDDLKVESYSGTTPVTTAATSVNETAFTANWDAVSGATGYTLTVQQSADNGATFALTAPGSPFTITNGATVSSEITGLTTNTVYRYKIVATDGTYSSPSSNFTTVTTGSTTGIKNSSIKALYAKNGTIYVNATSGKELQVYNNIGQSISKIITRDGINILPVNQKGIFIVKVDNQTYKIIL